MINPIGGVHKTLSGELQALVREINDISAIQIIDSAAGLMWYKTATASQFDAVITRTVSNNKVGFTLSATFTAHHQDWACIRFAPTVWIHGVSDSNVRYAMGFVGSAGAANTYTGTNKRICQFTQNWTFNSAPGVGVPADIFGMENITNGQVVTFYIKYRFIGTDTGSYSVSVT